MTSLSLTERYFAAHCAMLFATSIAAILVGFGIVWLARRRRDPARWSMTFIKFAALFLILYCFIEFCADAVWIAFSRLWRTTMKDLHGPPTAEYHINEQHHPPYKRSDHKEKMALLATLLQARIELTAASRFTDCVLMIFLFLSIVSLSIGVNMMRQGEISSLDKLAKRLSYGFAAALGAIAVAEWAIRIRVYLEFYVDKYDLDDQEYATLRLLDASKELDFAFVILTLVLSIVTMARAAQLWWPTYKEPARHHPAFYLLLSSIAWLIRNIYELVYQLKFVNIEDVANTPYQPSYIEIIDIIFHTWTVFAIICFMFILGGRKEKEKGLWTTKQPFHTESESSSSGSQDIPLENIEPANPRHSILSAPPAYDSSTSPSGPLQTIHDTTSNSQSNSPNGPSPHQLQQQWHQQPGVVPEARLGADDHGLIAGLGAPRPGGAARAPGAPERYQPPPGDNSYNTGIVSPVSPSEAGPADGYGMGMSLPSQSPPPHDEAMGLYHQADGRRPDMEPLPYPEKG